MHDFYLQQSTFTLYCYSCRIMGSHSDCYFSVLLLKPTHCIVLVSEKHSLVKRPKVVQLVEQLMNRVQEQAALYCQPSLYQNNS